MWVCGSMNPGKTYLPEASMTSAPAGGLNVAVDAGDRFAFAPDVGDVAGVAGHDFAVLDQQAHRSCLYRSSARKQGRFLRARRAGSGLGSTRVRACYWPASPPDNASDQVDNIASAVWRCKRGSRKERPCRRRRRRPGTTSSPRTTGVLPRRSVSWQTQPFDAIR